MKARIIATGEIVEVIVYKREHRLYMRIHDEKTGEIYRAKDLDFNIEDDNTPDYWEMLLHQYTGMAMQAMIKDGNNIIYLDGSTRYERLINTSIAIAHALIQKLKEE